MLLSGKLSESPLKNDIFHLWNGLLIYLIYDMVNNLRGHKSVYLKPGDSDTG